MNGVGRVKFKILEMKNDLEAFILAYGDKRTRNIQLGG